MKKITSYIGLSCSVFLLSGCLDYVNFDPKENFEIVASAYFRSPQDYEAAVVGAYDPLQWTYLNVLIGDIASDNSFSGGESATDVLGIQQIDDMTHDPNNDNLAAIWRWSYEGINRTNYLMENKNRLDFATKEALYAEVHFLRAYYYFELVKFFGDVPLFVDRRLTASDSGTKTRASKTEVYAQIEKDLLAAIANLPANPSQKGRITRFAAQALLGKVYLYQDKFSEAANVLENVIGVYRLVEPFATIFEEEGENGPESVFEIQYTNRSNWFDWGFTPQGTEGNFGVIHNGIRAFNGPHFASGWSFNVPTPKLVASYEAGDRRKDATILDIIAFAAQTGATYAQGYKHTGFFNLKYMPRAGQSGAQIELNYSNNYRAIRYADVLLMAAEANNRGRISDAKAQQFLNQVRRRAFGPNVPPVLATGQALTELIWKERHVELAMEGHRFFDLVRTKKAASEIPGFVAGKHEVFPIPQQEIDISGLTQNPGY
ncbi:MAG: RagB/SusD family nutrient uptake outer membrane protein [Spirosomataceae bacterium]